MEKTASVRIEFFVIDLIFIRFFLFILQQPGEAFLMKCGVQTLLITCFCVYVRARALSKNEKKIRLANKIVRHHRMVWQHEKQSVALIFQQIKTVMNFPFPNIFFSYFFAFFFAIIRCHPFRFLPSKTHTRPTPSEKQRRTSIK